MSIAAKARQALRRVRPLMTIAGHEMNEDEPEVRSIRWRPDQAPCVICHERKYSNLCQNAPLGPQKSDNGEVFP